MKMYALNLKLTNKRCLVVGGGRLAGRKVKKLLECGADVTLLSPCVTEELKEIIEEGRITYIQRNYKKDDLDEFFLIIVCTDNPCVNAEIFTEAESKQKLINSVDNPENCNFYVPASVVRGDLNIAISTSGILPYFAKKLRMFMEGFFPPEIGDDMKNVARLRNKIIQNNSGNESEKKEQFQNEIEPLVKELLEKIEIYAAYNRDKS